MRKAYFFSLLIVSLMLVLPAKAQHFFENNNETGKSYLLLAHPTVSNLKTVLFLIEQGIFDPGGMELVGVYHTDEAYNFNESLRFVQEQKLENVHFQQVTGRLYADSVYCRNGCTPEFRRLFEHSKGLILFGGPDIQPELYGQENSYSVVTDPNRHLFELSFLFHLLGGSRLPGWNAFLNERPEYLLTGFCLGMQSMNVATGGTLVQDIPAQWYNATEDKAKVKLGNEQLHRNYWQNLSSDTLLMGVSFHPIRFTADDFFAQKVGYMQKSLPVVLSSHHQAADQIGQGWLVTARSADGNIVEGIRHNRFPNVFAVQFHPEVPALYREGKKMKFSPEDRPESYRQRIGKNGLRFHRQYWNYISQICTKSVK